MAKNATNKYQTFHDILANGRGIYHPADGLKIDSPGLTPAEDLILTVLATIEGQSEPVIEAQQQFIG